MSFSAAAFRGFFLLILLPVSLLAQEGNTGNWMMYFGMNKLSNKISLHTEVQYRNHTLLPNQIEQLLLRTGLNYHFSNKAFATAGYAHISSYDFKSEQKPPETTEHRIWQQFILNNQLGKVKFEHRYRIEQRWVNQEFKSRFRYRLMLFLPLNSSQMEAGSFFLGLYDEVFINGKSAFFDRNRLYGALGYQFHKTANLQVGMLHQQTAASGKWYLQFALAFNPDLRKRQEAMD